MKPNSASCFGVLFVVFAPAVAAANGTVMSSEYPGAENTRPGAFTQSLPIEIPLTRGFERPLELYYSSERGNGPLGLGWSIEGVDFIQRGVEGRGAPRFLATDSFYHRGEPLIECTERGGTHCRKRSSDLQIRYRNASADWVVRTPDGTQHRYGAKEQSPGGVFRWWLDRVTDVHGNYTTYTQSGCNSAAGCRLTDVRYYSKGASGSDYLYRVRFLYGVRPDQFTSYGVGTALRTDQGRLIAVVVLDGSSKQPAWGYKLSYRQTLGTGQSQLKSVQPFGRDLRYAQTFGITSGSRLPATTFTYYPENRGTVVPKPAWDAFCSEPGAQLLLGDFNANGRTDLLCYRPNHSNVVAFSTGNGQFNRKPSWARWCASTIDLADFNGDGATDLLCHDRPSGRTAIATSNGDGTFSQISNLREWCRGSNRQAHIADVNGDGRDDLICHSSGGFTGVTFAAANGSFVHLTNGIDLWSLTGWCHSLTAFNVADIDGDGRADLQCHTPQNNWVLLSTNPATSMFGPIWAARPPPDGRWCDITDPKSFRFGDFNGDGKDDYLCHGPTGFNTVVLSHGNGGFSQVHLGDAFNFCDGPQARLSLADFNGDGRTDLQCHTAAANRIALSRGDGRFAIQAATPRWCGTETPGAFRIGDFNGDGRADYLCHVGGANTVALASGSSGSLRMRRIKNLFGGTTEVEYRPASAFKHADAPPAGVVVTKLRHDDGVAGTPDVVNRYTYSGGVSDPFERRFLGFRYVRSTDATNAYAERYFTMHPRDPVGTLELLYERDASGDLMRFQKHVYSRTGDGVSSSFRAQGIKTWTYDCEGDRSCKRALVDVRKDVYGNVFDTLDHGDYDVLNDHVRTRTSFARNVALYLVSRPSGVKVVPGFDLGVTALQHRRFYYDNNASTAAAPTRGLLTRASAWRDLPTAKWVNVERNAYDRFGNKVEDKDALGRVTRFVYEPGGLNLDSITSPTGLVERFDWDARCGEVSVLRDPNNLATRRTYDVHCRLKRELRPQNKATAFSYSDWGKPQQQLVQRVESDGHGGLQFVRYFDGFGRARVMSREGPSASRTSIFQTYLYDGRGLLERRSAPYYVGPTVSDTPKWTTFAYDALHRRTATIFPDDSARTVAYLDARTVTTDEAGFRVEHRYDTYGDLRQTLEFVGGATNVTRTHVDLLGRRIAVDDADANGGNRTVTQIDSLGRIVLSDDPDLGRWRYTYDDAGQLTERVDAASRRIRFTYDRDGRLRKRIHGSTTLAEFRYDQQWSSLPGFYNRGLLTQVLKGDDFISFNYDASGLEARIARRIGGQTRVEARTYDAADRLATLRYPDGEVVRYVYDKAGRVSSVRAGTTVLLRNATYDARDQLVTRRLGNDIVETRTYDPNRFWLRRAVAKRGQTAVHDVRMTFNRRGDVRSRVNVLVGSDRWNFAYDALRRLRTATNQNNPSLTQRFEYDAIGNLTFQTGVGAYSYARSKQKRPHAPVAAGSVNFTYDANGNRLSGGTTLAYDVENQVRTAGGVNMRYDGLGDRTMAGSTRFFGDIYEAVGSAVTKHYFADGERIARRRPSGQLDYFHRDFLKTPSTRTNATGGVDRRKVVSPFGRMISGGDGDRYALADERLDSSGLYHMGARYMDPRFGKWVSPDPAPTADPARPQTLNRYAYVNNAPTRLTDPTGFYGEAADGSDNDGDAGAGAANAGGQADAQAGENDSQGNDGGGGGDSASHATPDSPEIGDPDDGMVSDADLNSFDSLGYGTSASGTTEGGIRGAIGAAEAAVAAAAGRTRTQRHKRANRRKTHKKGKRNSTHNRHTNPRPGGMVTKAEEAGRFTPQDRRGGSKKGKGKGKGKGAGRAGGAARAGGSVGSSSVGGGHVNGGTAGGAAAAGMRGGGMRGGGFSGSNKMK